MACLHARHVNYHLQQAAHVVRKVRGLRDCGRACARQQLFAADNETNKGRAY